MKNPNNILIALITLIILSAVSDCISQRNTIWLPGPGQNSRGWGQMQQEMLARGFLFDNLMNSSFNPGLGVVAAADQVEGMIGNNDNVLGIAHDYGGIVLRDLQIQDRSITAMILDGVPNQGSTGLSAALSGNNGDQTRAQKLVEAVNGIMGDDDCNDCGMIQAFESWINSLDGGSEFLDDVEHDSEIIQNLESPTVPFAILYGTVEELSLHSLMSSRAFPSDIDHFSRCYTATLNREREAAMDATTRALIDNTQGFFSNVITALTTIIDSSVTGTVAIISTAAEFLTSSRDRIAAQIEAARERDEELARILRCELSNQYAAADWQLLLMENSEREQIEVDVPGPTVEYADCIQQCGIDKAFGDWNSNLTCDEACMDLMAIIGTEMVTVILSDPNDGLLTESEQKLEGYAGEPYHLMNTNHFQETSASNDDAVDALEDIFMGGAGAAFIVPK